MNKKEENKKWYAVPPYQKTELWRIYNEDGEFIADFEVREHCERVVILWNNAIESGGKNEIKETKLENLKE